VQGEGDILEIESNGKGTIVEASLPVAASSTVAA
jgi:hypothetical protein